MRPRDKLRKAQHGETVAVWILGLATPLTLAIWLVIRFCHW